MLGATVGNSGSSSPDRMSSRLTKMESSDGSISMARSISPASIMSARSSFSPNPATSMISACWMWRLMDSAALMPASSLSGQMATRLPSKPDQSHLLTADEPPGHEMTIQSGRCFSAASTHFSPSTIRMGLPPSRSMRSPRYSGLGSAKAHHFHSGSCLL